MFEQMREAGLAIGLVLRTDVVPDGHRSDRRLVILVDDHRKAVLELKQRVRDGDLTDQRWDRDRLRGSGKRRCRERGRGGKQGNAAESTHQLEFSGEILGGKPTF